MYVCQHRSLPSRNSADFSSFMYFMYIYIFFFFLILGVGLVIPKIIGHLRLQPTSNKRTPSRIYRNSTQHSKKKSVTYSSKSSRSPLRCLQEKKTEKEYKSYKQGNEKRLRQTTQAKLWASALGFSTTNALIVYQ